MAKGSPGFPFEATAQGSGGGTSPWACGGWNTLGQYADWIFCFDQSINKKKPRSGTVIVVIPPIDRSEKPEPDLSRVAAAGFSF